MSIQEQNRNSLLCYRRLLAIVLAIGIVLLSGCELGEIAVQSTKVILPEARAPENYSGIPFANESELDALTEGNDQVIDWNLARKTVIIEMEQFHKKSNGWSEQVRIARRPIVIYDANSNPALYEFFVFDQGLPIATIAAYATKISPIIIRNVLPFTRNYSDIVTKWQGYDQINIMYPSHMAVGIAGKSGTKVSSVMDPHTGEAIALSEEEVTDNNYLSEEQIATLIAQGVEAGDLNKGIAEMQEYETQMKEFATQYWAVIEIHKEQLLTIQDEELYAIYQTKGFWDSGASFDWSLNDGWWIRHEHERFEIIDAKHVWASGFEDFSNTESSFRDIRWDGWCTPAAMAMLKLVWDGGYGGVDLTKYAERYQNEYKQYDDELYRKSDVKKNLSYDFTKLAILRTDGKYAYNYASGQSNSRLGSASKNKDWIEARSLEADGGFYIDLLRQAFIYDQGFDYDLVNLDWESFDSKVKFFTWIEEGFDFGGAVNPYYAIQAFNKLRNKWRFSFASPGPIIPLMQGALSDGNVLVELMDPPPAGGGVHTRLIVGHRDEWWAWKKSWEQWEQWPVWELLWDWFPYIDGWESAWLHKEIAIPWGLLQYFMIWDNGATTGDQGYKPYWENVWHSDRIFSWAIKK